MSANGTVVFAAGNRSRGDDAIGPLLLERLEHWLSAQGRRGEFALIDDFQWQVEHALDLREQSLALFLDAGWSTPAPLVFGPVASNAKPAAVQTHALSPQALLAVYRQGEREEPPPAFVLCVRGERFDLGAGLSAAGEAHLEAAWCKLMSLCDKPDAQRWRAMSTAD